MSAILTFIDKCNYHTQPTVAVVGDIMVDEYYEIESERLSPEFPIPVYLSHSKNPTVARPGGAANVAYQFKNLKTKPILYGFTDAWSRKVLNSHDIYPSSGHGNGLDPNVKQIPLKRRLYNKGFPLCRWDIEKPLYGHTEEQLNIRSLGLFKEFEMYNPEITIFSDYNKGFFTNLSLQMWLTNKSTISIVDPKKGPASKWKGCKVFKPNSKEAEAMSGYSDYESQLKYFADETEAELVVITLGGEGVVALAKGEMLKYVPTKTISAESVIGAGDCFISMLAMALGHKMDYLSALEVAFEAGAVYVQRKHNEPISMDDLKRQQNPLVAKMVDPRILRNPRGEKLVFTNGCFDFGLTQAHVQYLNWAKSQGDKLVVALNSDASVTRLKGEGRPVMSLNERMNIIAGLESVDYVVSFDEDTPLELIKYIGPNTIIKGGDYRVEDVVGREYAEVRLAPKFEGMSTTEKISKL